MIVNLEPNQNDCQFGGLSKDDPYEHITVFLEIFDKQQYSSVQAENVRLMIFSFSVRDKVTISFKSVPMESIAMWEEMGNKFLTEYFSPTKLVKFRDHIITSTQFDSESIYDAWKRYKDLIRIVSNHGLPVGGRSNSSTTGCN